MDEKKLRLDTLALYADHSDIEDNAVVAPIYQSVNFFSETAAEFTARSGGFGSNRAYMRQGNPTNARAADVICALESAEAGLVFPSGMAAISAAMFALVKQGDHIICQEQTYAGTQAFLANVMRDYGVDVTFVDQRLPEAFESAITSKTRLIVLETPCHPFMHVTDLRAVAGIAREHNVLTLIDNTTATPINQRPIDLGIDIVVHSATKSLGGHSDILAGAVVGPSEIMRLIWKRSTLLGTIMSPHDAWLLLRGMRTLALRVARHNENGMALARVLEGHPAVSQVYYPGLKSHPQHALAASQMKGFGGVLGLTVNGGDDAAERFIRALRRIRRASSIGSVESLVVHPSAMWRQTLTPEQLEQRGVGGGLIRLSVGIDATEDLIEDVSAALEASQQGARSEVLL